MEFYRKLRVEETGEHKYLKMLDGIGDMYPVASAKNDFPCLTYPKLEEIDFIDHLFTTRLGGVSEDIFASLNLSFNRGDDRDKVLENYKRVAAALNMDYTKMVCSDQTHTTNVRVVTSEDAGKGVVIPKDYTDTDGLITNVPGLTLGTFYADCVPLYFVDPFHKAIGLSHSGWKGTVARIGKATIEAMTREYGTDPADLICAIGPSICQDCYEISEDVAIKFIDEFSEHKDQIIYYKGNGKYQLDLWRTNEIVLTEAGVKLENISTTSICTCCNPYMLFSHRASHGKRGNLGAFLVIK